MDNIEMYIKPSIMFLALVALGFIIEKVLFPFFKSLVAKTAWKADDLIIHSLKKIPIYWGFLGGAYLAAHHVNLSEESINIADQIIFSLVVLSLCVIAGRFLVGLINLKTGADPSSAPSTSIISNIIKTAIYMIGFLVILQTMGISIAPVLTALGVGGLAVALALKDTFFYLFSVIQIIASKQIRRGDFIRLSSGEEGFVTDINWRNTIIKATSNNYVVIPNSNLATTIITNFHLDEKEIGISVEVGVAYDSDLDKVEKVTRKVAEETIQEITGGIPGFSPAVRFVLFGDSAITVKIVLRAKDFDQQHDLRSTFIKKLHLEYNKEGIEIPFPIRTVLMKNNSNT